MISLRTGVNLSVCVFVCVSHWLCVTPWTVARQAPLPMGLSRQEYWSGLPFPPPGDLPDSGLEPRSLALAGRFLIIWVTREARLRYTCGKFAVWMYFCPGLRSVRADCRWGSECQQFTWEVVSGNLGGMRKWVWKESREGAIERVFTSK